MTVPLPCDIQTDPDAHLTIRWAQRSASAWAPAGHQVAVDHLQLRPPRPHAKLPASSDPRTGAVGRAIASPVELSIFRAPVDNDGFKLMPELSRRIGVGGTSLVAWQDAGLDRRPADEFVAHDHDVEVLDDGSIVHRHIIDVPDELADLGRLGATFQLKSGFDRMRWFGRGPLENYPDRNRGAVLGTWEAGIDAAPYLVPQEFGLRTDCRWFEFTNSKTGAKLRLDVLDPTSLHVSATRFTAHDLYEAAHETDLRPRKTLIVHADVAHRGIGTASCGPDILDAYRVPTGRHTFSYRLSLTT